MKDKLPEFFKLFDLESGDRFAISDHYGNPFRLSEDYEILDRNGLPQRLSLLYGVFCDEVTLTKLPTITEKEDKILHALYGLGWNWIARDNSDDSDLRVYHEKPVKRDSYWIGGIYHLMPAPLYDAETYFQFIMWEDEEPFNIEEYVKGVNRNEH